MTDIATENYKKAVLKAVDRFGDKIDKIGKQMAPCLEQLAKLSDLKSPTEDDKKKLAEVKKQLVAFQAQLDKAQLELKTDLMLLEPPKNADPKETKKLPAWLEEIIKKKGIPLGKDVSVAPDVDFDFKTMQLKKMVVVFKIDLP
jgi:seryl-tRNA synthetase